MYLHIIPYSQNLLLQQGKGVKAFQPIDDFISFTISEAKAYFVVFSFIHLTNSGWNLIWSRNIEAPN